MAAWKALSVWVCGWLTGFCIFHSIQRLWLPTSSIHFKEQYLQINFYNFYNFIKWWHRFFLQGRVCCEVHSESNRYNIDVFALYRLQMFLLLGIHYWLLPSSMAISSFSICQICRCFLLEEVCWLVFCWFSTILDVSQKHFHDLCKNVSDISCTRSYIVCLSLCSIVVYYLWWEAGCIDELHL